MSRITTSPVALEKGRSYVNTLDVYHNDAGATTVEQVLPIFTLPKGAVITKVWTKVLEVFNSGTSDLLTVGTAADTDHLQDSGDITEGSTGNNENVVSANMPYVATADVSIVAGYTSTGTAPTTGHARVFVHWDYTGD